MRQSQALTRLDYESPSSESERCPKCGGARLFTTNALTGAVIVSCPTCEQLAARRAARAKWEGSAIAFVAAKYSITVEELELRCMAEVSVAGLKPRLSPIPCEACREQFLPTLRSQRFCGRAECRRERTHVHYEPRACAHCRKEFTPKTKSTRFCYREECRRSRERVRFAPRSCERCGEQFTPKTSRSRFCYRAECAPPPTPCRCAHCGGEFMRGARERTTFCPEHRSRWKRRVRKIGPRNYSPKPCRRCGHEFVPTGPRSTYCGRPECTPIATQEEAA